MIALVPASYVVLRRTADGAEQVLLQLRRGTGYLDEHWAVSAAGHVEAGEDAVAAAVREAEVELGPVVPHELRVVEGLRRGDLPPLLTHGF